MGAITPADTHALDRAKPYQGDRMEVHRFLNPSNGDTWTVPGGTGRIRDIAFRTASAQTIRWVVTNPTTMTFSSSGAVTSVLLFLFIKGGTSPA